MSDVPQNHRDAISAAIDAHLDSLIAFCRATLADEMLIYSIERVRQDIHRAAQQPAVPATSPLYSPAHEPKTILQQGILKVFNKRGTRIDIPEETPLSEMLPELTGGPPPERAVLVIRRTLSNLAVALQNLGIQDGDRLDLEPIVLEKSRNVLVLASPLKAHPPLRIDRSPSVLGRSEKCDINVVSLLPLAAANAVSRQQATFVEENGTWAVKLHENASVTMYVNKQKLTADQVVPLTEGAIISIGVDLDRPTLSFYVKFES